MNDTIVHRGPDGQGQFTEGTFGFGMRRLSIIDLEGGWQPIANELGTVQVVHNGEIYNYQQLRRELEMRGHQFRTHSDTEVAVHAFEEWGGFEFARHLRGMFAIAVWDSARRQLWLIRDRLGIKPLYVADLPQGLAFASELKALLASPIVRPDIDPRGIVDYLAFGNSIGERTAIRGVRQLEPGSVLCYTPERSETRRYWQFQIPANSLNLSEHDAELALRDKLKDAVASHLVADVPVGAFLSGGIDSSAIVGLMAPHVTGAVQTFSIGFQEDAYNELPYAEFVARQYQTSHHVELIRPDAVGIVDQLVRHFDEPFADPSAIPTWYVAQLAAKHVKVVLSGDGGDELFAGYTRYQEADRHRAIDRIPRFLRRAIAHCLRWAPDRTPGKYFLQYASLDSYQRYAHQLDLFPRSLRRHLLRKTWQSLEHGGDDAIEYRCRAMANCDHADLVARCMYLDSVHYLPLDILTKVDRMTMAHSLEARPPLLDHELVEFAAALPLHLKFKRDGKGKYVFKKAIADLLPPALHDRPKAGFSVPLGQWFAGPLAGMFQDEVIRDGRCHEFLEPVWLQRLFQQNHSQRRDHGYRLWAVLLLEKWLRHIQGIATSRSPARLETIGS